MHLTNRDLPPVSLIIITKNRKELLKQAINSIKSSDYPKNKLEILVLEETEHPTPITGTVYHTINVNNLGFGWARKKAVELASHEILLFTDDDCTVEPDWIRKMIETLLSDPAIAAAGGAVKIPPSNSLGKCENVLGFPGGGVKWVSRFTRGEEMPSFSTCNVAIKRDYYQKSGGFDEKMRFGGEDSDLSARIRTEGKIVYVPDGIVYHLPRGKFSKIFQWFRKRGKSEKLYAKAKGQNRLVKFLKSSLIVKASILAAASFCCSYLLPVGFLTIFLPLSGVYYLYLALKYSFSWKFYGSIPVLLLTPIVRLWMDLARDIGYLSRTGTEN